MSESEGGAPRTWTLKGNLEPDGFGWWTLIGPDPREDLENVVVVEESRYRQVEAALRNLVAVVNEMDTRAWDFGRLNEVAAAEALLEASSAGPGDGNERP